MGERRAIKESPRKQRLAGCPSLAGLFGARVRGYKPNRNAAIKRAHLDYGYSLSEIGRVAGLHTPTISRLVGRKEERQRR